MRFEARGLSLPARGTVVNECALVPGASYGGH